MIKVFFKQNRLFQLSLHFYASKQITRAWLYKQVPIYYVIWKESKNVNASWKNHCLMSILCWQCHRSIFFRDDVGQHYRSIIATFCGLNSMTYGFNNTSLRYILYKIYCTGDLKALLSLVDVITLGCYVNWPVRWCNLISLYFY